MINSLSVVGQDKQGLGQKQLTNKATEGLDLLDKLANTYYGLVKEINRQSFSESNHLVGKNSQQDTKAIVNEVLDRLQIPVKQSWVNEQAKKGDAIDVLSKLKRDCQHKLNAEAVNHHHFTIALMRASYGHLAHTLNENDQSGKVLERFKALEKSLNQPPVEHSLKRLNRGAAFKHVNDMPYSSLKMSSTNSVSEAGVQVMREDSQLIRNTNFWYNKLRCGTQLDKNVKYTANISTQEAADRITGAVGGIAETLGVSAGYQGSYGREEQERTIMPYW